MAGVHFCTSEACAGTDEIVTPAAPSSFLLANQEEVAFVTFNLGVTSRPRGEGVIYFIDLKLSGGNCDAD